jgi:subtilisin family serine protease
VTPAPPRSTFVVQLRAPALASYRGELPAYPATSPATTAAKLDVSVRSARRYAAYLDAGQRRALAHAGARGAPVLYSYRAAFSGFAVRLSASEAARLAAAPEVAAVTADRFEDPGGAPGDRGAAAPGDSTAYLGLPDGLWKRLGGPDHAGEGVIVGVVDFGIHPEHPSFADRPRRQGQRNYLGPAYEPPRGWHGVCQGGEAFPVSACNDKLIGARYFVEGFGADSVANQEFLSPRDANGHGTHVAAIAAGNFGVKPVIDGSDLGVEAISGIAPRSYLAAYKACWVPNPARRAHSCILSDLVAAVDAAVSDGVDVINYSGGGTTPAPYGPLEAAFLGATDAGVFSTTIAGNHGPDPGSIGPPGAVPWLTSVAATTNGGTFEATARVVDRTRRAAPPLVVRGAASTSGLGEVPLRDAASVPAADVAPSESELCLPGSLDHQAVAGAAVLCREGTNSEADKSRAVEVAGGAGLVVANTAHSDEVFADAYTIPSLHVGEAHAHALSRFLRSARRPALSVGPARAVPTPPDVLASFSSRGPQTAVADVPKPDLAAPGMNILSGFSPTAAPGARPGERFAVMSGTSMACPAVAGAAALLLQLHPTWSPAVIRSALMTTADPTVLQEDGATPARPFDVGAGRIDPNRAADPGLVLDVDADGYRRYLAGVTPDAVDGIDDHPASIAPIAPVDLNLPGIAAGALAGTLATARSFTSVDPGPRSWEVRVEDLSGITARVSPRLLTLAPGESRSVKVTFTHAGARFDAYTAGALVLTDRQDGRAVRLPVSLRPVELIAPPVVAVSTSEDSGSAPFAVRAGFEGQLSATGFGLAPPRTAADQAVGVATPAQPTPQPGPGVNVYDVEVAAGAQLLAGAITNVGKADPGADLDLFLYFDGAGDGFDEADLIEASDSVGPEETITRTFPHPGRYRFAVVGVRMSDETAAYHFTTWLAEDPSPDDASNHPGITVSGDPVTVTPGAEVTLTLDWSGTAPDGTYFGLVTYQGSASPERDNSIGGSLIRIEKEEDEEGR